MPSDTLRAISCTEAGGPTRAVEAILARSGYQVVGQLESATQTVLAAGLIEPDIAVVDLALTGGLGLGAVAAIRAAAPRCQVVVVSSLDSMGQAALDAGAYGFAAAADLRQLDRCLRRLAAEPQVALEASAPSTEALHGSLSTKASAS